MKSLTGIFKIIFSFVAIAFTLADSLAQELFDAGYPPITNYTTKEYGGFPANWAITQDERGVIFVGNSRGLMEFDGVSWRMHPVSNNTEVRSLASDGQGKIYAGAQGELGFFEPDKIGKITYYSLVKYLPKNRQNFADIVMQTYYLDGVVYYKAGRSIFIWDPVREEFTVVEGKSDFHVSILANDRIYVMEWGTGLMVLDKNHTLSLVPGGGQFANESVYSILPFPGTPGTLLVTTRNMGLFTFDGHKFEPFYTEADDFLKENLPSFSGTILSDEKILLGTSLGGAVIIDRTGKILGHYDKQAGITNNFIGYTFQDRSGMVWLATNNGISIVDYISPLRFFDGRNQVLNDIYDVIRHDGDLYVTSLTQVYRLKSGSRNFQKFENLDLSWQFLMVAGEILVISPDGVYAIEGDDLKPIRKSVSNEYFVIFNTSRSNPSRVYVATRNGVFSLLKGKAGWVDEGYIAEISGPKFSIVETSDGQLWVGTASGLVNIQSNKASQVEPSVKHYGPDNGLQRGYSHIFEYNETLYVRASDSLYRFDKERDYFYSDLSDPLIESYYHFTDQKRFGALGTDRNGQVWIFSEDQIAKAVRMENGDYQLETLPYRRIGREFVSGIPYPDEHGITWFRTFPSYVIAFKENVEQIESPEFPALIRLVEVGTDSALYFGNGDQGQETILKFSDNAIRFTYAAASYEGKNSNRFKTMLDGFDRDWSSWSDLPVKEYVNLPPGEYTFRVIAQNLFGAESKPAAYTFTILPPWWQTWWAYFGYVLLIGGSIFTIYNFQLRQRLQKAEAQRLRELDAVKTKLYTNITHEFRTPLTVILGMAHQLMDNPKKHLEKGLKMIEKNGQSLLTMVNQMLDLSKLESGKLSLQYHHADVISFLRYIVDSFHSLAESKGIQIHFTSVSDQFKMYFDEVRLQQVISNIISNAIKFSPKGGNIYVITDITIDSFILKIKDTGMGIAEADLPHIFDRFYQADDSHTRQGEGTGIGLALTHELVKLMNGTIAVKSKIGYGAEFEVVLPLQYHSNVETVNKVPLASIETDSNHECTVPIDEASQLSWITPFQNGNSSAHVLIADDNEDVLAFVASCLENEFNVEIAKNGQECEDLAFNLTPDLIVMDVMMPFKNGFEVCKTLKIDERTSHIPIIMLTAKADLESKLQGLEQSADDYLTKPFHKKELLLRIKNLLDLRRHLQQFYRSSLEGSLSTNSFQDLQKLNINPEKNGKKNPHPYNQKSSIPLASSLENAFVIKVWKTIETHIEEPDFDVEKLCRNLALSHSQVHRKLSALTGLSATHFIRYVRLIKAKELILKSGFSITAIAYDCGFNDPSYFSRIFKQEFGVSPQVWREQNAV